MVTFNITHAGLGMLRVRAPGGLDVVIPDCGVYVGVGTYRSTSPRVGAWLAFAWYCQAGQ